MLIFINITVIRTQALSAFQVTVASVISLASTPTPGRLLLMVQQQQKYQKILEGQKQAQGHPNCSHGWHSVTSNQGQPWGGAERLAGGRRASLYVPSMCLYTQYLSHNTEGPFLFIVPILQKRKKQINAPQSCCSQSATQLKCKPSSNCKTLPPDAPSNDPGNSMVKKKNPQVQNGGGGGARLGD